jgi:micrococcal nuclease
MDQNKSKLLISLGLMFFSAGFGLWNWKIKNINPSVDCYKVLYIYDGDTIQIDLGGKKEKIRFLGIDTPELHSDGSAKPDCYAKDAYNKLKQMIGGSCVKLKADKLAGDRDKYGRLLRYVYLPNGTFLNYELLKQGYAFNYIYSDNEFKKQFSQTELEVKKLKLGLWGSCKH